MSTRITPNFPLFPCLLLPILFISLTLRSWSAERPNIIFILADDLGYGDLSCYGQEKFETPHIDKLAENGMLFTDHYSGSAVCAPARSSLLTGLHTGRTPIRGNAERFPEGQVPLPASTFTVGHFLQRYGYKTGVFGKWGLGYPGSEGDPLQMGFDRFYGYNCQRMAHSYYPAWLWDDDQREYLWGNTRSFQKQDYAPDFIHKEVLNFISDNQENPFFIYYAAVQPHADMDAPDEAIAEFRGKFPGEKPEPEGYYIGQEEPYAAFAAMVTILDNYVGDLVSELERLGIAEDTLIIFSSDNGPHDEGGADPEYFNSNGKFRGIKRDLYEGGVRVPMIAHWPGRISPGSVSDHPSAFWDFFPTVADLLKKPVQAPMDGLSFVPTLLNEGQQEQHRYLYWEFPQRDGRVAVRAGKWKAVRYKLKHKNPGAFELYDLENDPGETVNLATDHPEIVKTMQAYIEEAHTPTTYPQFTLDVN
ncbi:MAG: arylsulfatase [Opitutales bacterium]